MIYYQLKQVDFDGQSETFPLIFVSGVNRQASLSVYPNPTKRFININTALPILQASLIDPSGRVTRKFNLSEFSKAIDISEVESGSYLLFLEFESHNELVRIVKN